MASLFVIQGRDQGSRFQLEDAVHSIGRTHTHSVRLHDTEVSRNHAELIRKGNSYAVRDLGSSNGTFVNGKLVSEQELTSGDQVQVGRSLLLYTGFLDDRLEDAAGQVDIVPLAGGAADDGSRIVASLGQTGGSEWLMPDARGSSNPWLARARSNLQIMYRTALAVSHTMDIDQLLARIMDMIFDWVEADRGCIMLKDLETGKLTPKVRRHRRGVRTEEKISISKTILDYVVEAKRGRPHQQRPRRLALGSRSEHRQPRRPRSDLRADAGTLRSRRRHLHRYGRNAAEDARRQGRQSVH